MVQKKVEYRVLLAELNQLLVDMQSDELDVDEVVKKYERGQALIRQLNAYLDTTENEVIIRRSNMDSVS